MKVLISKHKKLLNRVGIFVLITLILFGAWGVYAKAATLSWRGSVHFTDGGRLLSAIDYTNIGMSRNKSVYNTGYNNKLYSVDTNNGQHEYSFIREAKGGWTKNDLNWALSSCVTIQKWTHSGDAQCIHSADITTPLLEGNYYDFSGGRCSKVLDFWHPTCVDCGNLALKYNFYADRSQLSNFHRLNQVNGNYWFSCAYCTSGNQGAGTQGIAVTHTCKHVSYNKYTVNYNANGGVGTTNPTTHIYNNGIHSFEIVDVYNTNADAGVKEYTYQYNGAKLSTATNKLAMNNFTREGYTFYGWSTNPNQSWDTMSFSAGSGNYKAGQEILNLTGKTADNQSLTLYAVWKPNTWILTYNSNKPSSTSSTIQGTMASKTYLNEQGCTLDTNKFSLQGYTFQGWSTTASGKVEYKDGVIVPPRSTNLTLYAVWKANEYNVNVYNNKPDSSTGNVTNIK